MTARGGRVLTNAPAAISRALVNANVFASRAVHTMYIPVGPWPVGATEEETQWIQAIGEMMRRNGFEFINTLRPMLKSQGFEDEVIERFIEGALCGKPVSRPAHNHVTLTDGVCRTQRPFRSYVHALGIRICRQASSACEYSGWRECSALISAIAFFLRYRFASFLLSGSSIFLATSWIVHFIQILPDQ